MTADRHGVEHLVVARESAERDVNLLEGMVQQTLAQYPSLPGRDRLLAIGADPVVNPSAYDDAEVLEEGRTRAVLFQVDGTWCLYSWGSAVKADADNENGFCQILIAVVRRLRPRNVYLATFSRLVRSPVFSGEVMGAMRDNVGVIRCRETPIDLSTPMGLAFWQMLTMFSTMERDAQMTRLTLGLIAKNRRGEWLFGAKSVPLGYRLENRKPVVDDAAAPLVRELVRALGDPDATTATIVGRLADLGLSSPAQNGNRGWRWNGHPDGDRARTVADMNVTSALVKRWYELLDAYETGRIVTPWDSPIEGVRKLAEHDVVPRAGDRRAHLLLTTDLGLPPGGWATADEFAAARAQATRRGVGRESPADRLPFAGPVSRWSAAGRDHALVGQHRYYSMLVKPADGSPWLDRARPTGTAVGSVETALLHRAVAEGVAAAIAGGVPAEAIDGAENVRALAGPRAGHEPTGADRRRRLAAAAAAARDDAARLQRVLAAAPEDGDPALLAQMWSRADAAARKAERLAAERDALAAQSPTALGRTFATTAELLLAVLAELANVPGKVPAPVARAVGTVFDGLRLEPDPGHPDLVRWTAWVKVPAAGRTVRLGPITGTVPQTGRAAVVAARPARAALSAERFMTADVDIASLGGPMARTGRGEHGRIRDELVRLGLTRKAACTITLNPVVPARAAVWAALTRTPIPDGVDPGFAAHMARAYLDGPGPTARLWYRPVRHASAFLPWLEARGGRCTRDDAERWAADTGAAANRITRMLQGAAGSAQYLDFVGERQNGRDRRDVALVGCLHCPGKASFPLNVHEVPACLLCPRCRRMPLPASPVFPQEYLELTEPRYRELLGSLHPLPLVRRVGGRNGGSSASVARWARENGVHYPDDGSGGVPGWVRDAYAQALRPARPSGAPSGS